MAVKADKAQVRRDYVAGGGSYATLARRYNISESTVKRWSREENWVALRAEAEQKTAQKTAEAVAKGAAAVETDVQKEVSKLLKRFSQSLDREPEVMGPTRLKEYSQALAAIQGISGAKAPLDLREQKAKIRKLENEAKLQSLELNEKKEQRASGGFAFALAPEMEGYDA